MIFEGHIKLLKDCVFDLSTSEVLIAGLSSNGCIAANILIRTGVSHLYLWDSHKVEEKDLAFCGLYDREDVGKNRADVLSEKLRELNPKAKLEVIDDVWGFLREGNFRAVVDGLEDFEDKMTFERILWERSIPFVYGFMKEYMGQVSVIWRGKSRRLFEIVPKSLEENIQIFPAVAVLVGAQQAAEAIKVICGFEDELLAGRLLSVDTLTATFDEIIF